MLFLFRKLSKLRLGQVAKLAQSHIVSKGQTQDLNHGNGAVELALFTPNKVSLMAQSYLIQHLLISLAFWVSDSIHCLILPYL